MHRLRSFSDLWWGQQNVYLVCKWLVSFITQNSFQSLHQSISSDRAFQRVIVSGKKKLVIARVWLLMLVMGWLWLRWLEHLIGCCNRGALILGGSKQASKQASRDGCGRQKWWEGDRAIECSDATFFSVLGRDKSGRAVLDCLEFGSEVCSIEVSARWTKWIQVLVGGMFDRPVFFHFC